jgi:hypothetical protein
MENVFQIRCYPFIELAQLYFPNVTKKSASKQLKKWICLNENLSENLFKHGLGKTLRILSPAQVKLIIEILGEP